MTSLPPADRSDRRTRALPLLLGALAAALRLRHLGWGLPAVEEEALPMKKAFTMWGWEHGRIVLDPETAGWPALSFYVHLLAQHLHYGLGRVLGWFGDRYDYYVAYLVDPTAVTLVARGVGVAASAVAIAVVSRLALRIGGWAAALGVGLVLVVSPLLVEHGQLITPDILLMMCVVLAVQGVVDIRERGRTRDYVVAAVWLALGAACKYTPVLLAPGLYVAHLLRLRAEGRSLRAWGLADRRLGFAVLAAVVAFAAASPYTLADLGVLRRDFAYQSLHLSAGHFGHEGHGPGLIHYATRVLPHALGWPAFLLATLGLGAAAVRRGGVWLVLLVCVLPFYLALGSLSTSFDRYMLPVVPVLALGLAALWREFVAARLPRSAARTAVGLGLLAVVCLPPAAVTWGYLARQGRPSTQELAREWLVAHAGPDTTTLALEMYAPDLPTESPADLAQDPVFAQLDAAQQERLLARPYWRCQYLPMYSTRTELSAFYYDLRHYLAYDYVVVTGAVERRYAAQPEAFPAQRRFYADLDVYATRVAGFAPEGRRRGSAIEIYALDAGGGARLLAERGELPPESFRAHAGRVHPPHLTAFLEFVAQHAVVAGRYDIAARYYADLYAYLPPAKRPRIVEQRAYAEMLAGDLDAAERLYREALGHDPRSGAALGNMGYVQELRGRYDEARRYYEACIAADPAGDAAEWAHGRLRALTERLGEPTDPDGG